MFENAKSDSKIIVHLNLKEETDRSEAVESAHATEKKPLMQKTTIVGGGVEHCCRLGNSCQCDVPAALLGNGDFGKKTGASIERLVLPLFYVSAQSYASAVNSFRNDSARSS